MTSWCADCLFGGSRRGAWVRGNRSFARACALLLAGMMLVRPPSPAWAHVPVPDSVLNPQSAPEAWNVLRLAVANIERLVREDRLTEIPDQASLCSPALRTLARLAEATPGQKEVAIETVRASSSVNSLAQACIAGDHASVGRLLEKLHAALAALALGTDPQIVNADVFFCQMHPDVVSLDAKALCPKCGMALTPRRIPYSFVYVAPSGEPSMRMTAECATPPLAGQPVSVKVHLMMRDGNPVNAADLLVAHTQRIHLLIVDSALGDYHHEHPTPTGVPGEYEFAFTPATSGRHRIYADVVPAATGIQEYVPASLPAGADATLPEDQPRVAAGNTFNAEAGGLSFQLRTETGSQMPVHVRQACTLQILVRKANGEPVTCLEPVMNAFAHLVGFYDDNRTIVHLHPGGAEVSDAALRGGPMLEFRFYPPKEGVLRLYCQVQVGGEMVFAPFTISVVP